MASRRRNPLNVTLVVNGTPEARRRALAEVVDVIMARPRGEATAPANDIAEGGCAAQAGRRQAEAAAPADSLQKPAVE